MRTEITYYAFDDTEFYDEYSCRNYEQEFFSTLNSVIMRDEDLKPIEVSEDNYGDAADAYYIIIVDADKARTLFTHLEGLIGTAQPKCEFENNDILVYDEEGDWDNSWVNLSRRVMEDSQRLKHIAKEVSKSAKQKE